MNASTVKDSLIYIRRLGAVYLLGIRAEVGKKLLKFIAELGKPQKIVTDNAEEFKSGSFADI